MPDILHRIGATTAVEKVYDALTTRDALAAWWTTGWREPVEFMAHCTTKWATYLLSLKQLLETGTGAPHPRDVLISNWH